MRHPLSPFRFLFLLALVASGLTLSACEQAESETHLRIVQVQFSDTVVLPGETITMSAVTDSDGSITWLWEAEAGEFAETRALTVVDRALREDFVPGHGISSVAWA